MAPIRDVPNITLGGFNIPNIVVRQSSTSIGGVWIKRPFVRDINNLNIADSRSWMVEPPQAIPPVVPVTIRAGTPIVDMPGCVRVHKENAKNPNNKNKQLVNDDPKQNVVLCDNGMPYYQPPEYDYRELSWQTVNPNEEEVDEGVNTDEPPAPDLDTPEPPPAGGNRDEPIECPPLNARRVGDLSTNGLERIKEYKLTPDGRVCETIWEPVPTMDQYLPSIGTVSTTATIGAVAATSALLAKPLADLLLKIVKPAVKKVVAKIQKMTGKKEKVLKKKPPVLSRRERLLKQREANSAVKAARKLKGE